MRFVQISMVALVAIVLVGSAFFFTMQAHASSSTASFQQPTKGSAAAPTGTHSKSNPVESQICTATDPHAVNLSARNGNKQVLYTLSGQGGYQTLPMNTRIVAYDLQHQTTQTLVRSNQGSNIVALAVSPNQHWVLVDVRLGLTTTGERMELMSADGSYRMVLQETCASPFSNMTSFFWSPDSTQIAYINSDASAVIVLNLVSGQIQPYVINYGSPTTVLGLVGWADAQHLVVKTGNDMLTHLYAVDLSKGSHQEIRNLHEFTNVLTACGNVALSHGVVYVSTCNGLQDANGCQGHIVQGPSAIIAFSLADGSKKTVYASATNSVIALSVSGSHVFFWVLNVTGDAAQSGLWSVNVDGSNSKHLTTTSVSPCIYQQFAHPAWQIASNGQHVATISLIPGAKQVVSVSDLNGNNVRIVSQAQIGATNNVFALGFGKM